MPARFTDTFDVQVSLNGDQIPGLLRASIMTTNCFSADTYSLTFAVGSDESGSVTFWSVIPSAYVEVTAVSSSAYGPTRENLITGMIDTIHVDPIQGIVGVEGRDMSSSMIDSYRQQDFVNQTSSEIVSTIAQYHNLEAVVAPTSGNVGRYYSDGYTKLSLGQFSRLQSDWDLVVQLARQNDFDVFVEGRILYFQPSGQSAIMPVPVSLQNVQHARIERSLNLATNAAARVQSWNSQNMAAYSSDNARDEIPVNLSASTGSSSTPFLFSGSNYTSQQVSEAAERYAAELTRLHTILHLDMPWDLSLSPRGTIVLNDAILEFDMAYRIDSVERHYSSTTGSKQFIRAARI